MTKNKKTVPQQNKNTEYLNKKKESQVENHVWIGYMNQDVYRIRKCFSHRDCVIKITSKASQPETILLSITTLFFVSLSGIFKRHHKAGLVSTMIDSTTSTGKCTLGPSEVCDVLVLHSGLHAMLQSLVFTRNLTLLGLDVKWNMMLITQARLHFQGIYCCFSLLNRQLKRFWNMHCRWGECWFLLHLVLTQLVGEWTMFNGGFSVWKASVAIAESLYLFNGCFVQ